MKSVHKFLPKTQIMVCLNTQKIGFHHKLHSVLIIDSTLSKENCILDIENWPLFGGWPD